MGREGIKNYYRTKIEEAELTINDKTQNLRRLEAQRNALNAKGMFKFCLIDKIADSLKDSRKVYLMLFLNLGFLYLIYLFS